MAEHGTNDRHILEMALSWYEGERAKIEEIIGDIQIRMGNFPSEVSKPLPTTKAEAETPRKKRFSAAARKRMAAAQRRRWKELKANRAESAKTNRKPTFKRRKASTTAPGKRRPVQAQAAKKVTSKATGSNVRAAAPKVKKAVAKSKVRESAHPARVAESTPTEATA